MPAIETAPAPTTTETPSTYRSFADLAIDLPEADGDPVETAPPAADKPETVIEKAAPAAAEKPESKSWETSTNPNLEEAPAAKVEKVADAADDEVPKGMTGKAVETWKTLKKSEKAALAEVASTKAEMAALRKELEEAGKTGPEIDRLKKEHEEARARLAEMEGEVAISRVESTRQFKEQVTAPTKAGEEVAAALATKYEVDGSTLLTAMREPDAGKRADLLEELTTDFKRYDQTQLFRAADEIAAAQKVAGELRGNASTKLEELTRLEKQEAERAATGNAEEYRKAAGAEWKAVQELHPILRPVDGKDEWNAYLAGIRQEVESVDVNNLPVAEVARSVAQARALPEMVKAMTFFRTQSKDFKAKLAAAEERLAEYRTTDPGAGAGATQTNGKGESSGSFIDSVFEEDSGNEG